MKNDNMTDKNKVKAKKYRNVPDKIIIHMIEGC